MNTYESYVSLETAKLLKQAGFDWEVDTSYVRDYGGMDDDAEYIPLDTFWFGEMGTKNWNREELSTVQYGKHKGLLTRASAPSLTVAQKWLREVKGIDVVVSRAMQWNQFYYTIEHEENRTSKIDFMSLNEDLWWFKYEEAQEAGIKKALEIILEKGE